MLNRMDYYCWFFFGAVAAGIATGSWVPIIAIFPAILGVEYALQQAEK